MADVTRSVGNAFTSQRFYTGIVKDNKLEEIDVHELRQGDIIHFRPLVPVIGTSLTPGVIAVVHATSPEGVVYLGNARISPEQLKEMSDLHVSGRF
jgi:hypothetical protein